MLMHNHHLNIIGDDEEEEDLKEVDLEVGRQEDTANADPGKESKEANRSYFPIDDTVGGFLSSAYLLNGYKSAWS